MQQLIAGNWKMNGLRAQARALAGAVAAVAFRCEVALFPPATLLAAVAEICAGGAVGVGGQDCSPFGVGARTGDVAASQLVDAGASWVLLGHSERRAGHAETDALVRSKVVAATAAGLRPIVCVGEHLADREAGRQDDVVAAQLAGSLPDGFDGVVAYEPVWAIGTGRVAEPEQVAAMHAHVRALVGPGVRILYGGSVTPANAATLLALPEVGGALVGGASLVAESFLAIADAALPRGDVRG